MRSTKLLVDHKMASQSGNILNNDAVDPAGFYILKHSLKVRTFKIHSRAAIVRVYVVKQAQCRLVSKKTIADFLLVAD